MKQRLGPRMPLAPLKDFEKESKQEQQNVAERSDVPALGASAPAAASPAFPVDSADQHEEGKPEAKEIPLKLIDKSRYQPRIKFDPAAIDALAATISGSGLMSPVTVREMPNGRYELIGGERRWRAHVILGKEMIPSYVLKNVSSIDAAIGALADNEAKEGLCDYERGKAYQRALALEPEEGQPKINQGILARRIGVSDATISRCLAYFDLPAEALAMLDSKPDLIGAKNASILVKLAKGGHEQLVLQALKRIQEGASEQGAVNWVTGEVNRLLTPPKEPQKLSLNGLHIGDIVTEGVKVVITCKNGFNPQDLVAKIKAVTEGSSSHS